MSVVIVRSFSAGTAASALVMGSLLGTLPIGRHADRVPATG